MIKNKIAHHLPVENQTQAKSPSPTAGIQSKTSGSHGNPAGNRSKKGFLLFTLSLLPLLLFTALWIACNQPSSGNSVSNSSITEGGERTFTVRYQEYPPAFLITFDKDVAGLSARDFEIGIENTGEGLKYTRGALSGPDAEHTYTLPVIYKTGNLISGSFGLSIPISAALSVVKEGWTFTDLTETALTITFRRAVWTNTTAYPLASTATKLSKLIFTFEQEMPDFSKEDIVLGNTQFPITTTITGDPVHIGNYVYEVPVTGVSSVDGEQLLIVNIIKNGHYFTRNAVAESPMPQPYGVYAFYEKSTVNSVAVSSDPADRTVPFEFNAWPKTYTLTATVNYTNNTNNSDAEFTLDGAPAGVTLTDNQNGTATLSIAGDVSVAAITVVAKAKADLGRAANPVPVFIIEKNVAPVTNDGDFKSKFEDATTRFIVINSEIKTPTTITGSGLGTFTTGARKTIEIRSGGNLVVRTDTTYGFGSSVSAGGTFMQGTIIVRSGGKIEIEGGKALTLDSATASTIVFGDVVFPSGMYSSGVIIASVTLEKKTSLSYTVNGADKRVIIDGEADGIFVIDPNPAGTSTAWKHINFPVGYSLVLKQGVWLQAGNYLAFDFGPIMSDVADEAGIYKGKFRAQGGDAILSAIANGLEIKAGANGAYLENSGDIYCAPGKEIQFPVANPLKIVQISVVTIGPYIYTRNVTYYEISSVGGAKISVPISVVNGMYISNNIVGISNESPSTLNVTAIGTGGTLDFTIPADKYVFIGKNITVNLGGVGDNEVGRIVLKNKVSAVNGTSILLSIGAKITSENQAADGAYSFSNTNVAPRTLAATTVIKGSASPSRFVSVENTAASASAYIDNKDTTANEAFVISSKTVMTTP
jgi:hypothetical protein